MKKRKEKAEYEIEMTEEQREIGEKVVKQFKKELEDLINRYSIDTICNKPDYELSEMIWELLALIAK